MSLLLGLGSWEMVNAQAAEPPPLPTRNLSAKEYPSSIPSLPLPKTPPPPPKPTSKGTGFDGRTQALRLVAQLEYPILKGGNAETRIFTETLTISAKHANILRRNGRISHKLRQELHSFAKKLAIPHDARFEELSPGEWVVVQRNGVKIDLNLTEARLRSALLTQQVQAIPVAFQQGNVIEPRRTIDFFRSRGITDFYATGASNYYGSSKARVTNIQVGASKFVDRLVKGPVFSFNQVIGPINQQSGYVSGLVIVGDKTASGVGGGICQVSTTVFRTLFGAGLPIIERHNHSYQVRYYTPHGLDATIYQPSHDLKFKNNTGGPLWFQATIDPKHLNLLISVFGRARNYEVLIESPRQLSSKPSPPNQNIYDRTLPAGKKVQVEWAAQGGVVEVVRKLMRGNQVLRKDILTSRYRPWPNKYRIGTGR